MLNEQHLAGAGARVRSRALDMSPAKSHNRPNDNVSNLARRYFGAYENKDRRFVEDLLSEGFTLSSPLDAHIDKETYFERCWPNSSKIRSLKIEKLFAAGSEVFVRYKSELFDGATFRNTELLSFEGNKLAAVDVYFGRTLREAGNP